MPSQSDCESLYQEYLELKKIADISFTAHQHNPGTKIELSNPHITVKQMERYVIIKKELVQKCKKCINLKPWEWEEIEN